MYFGGRYELTKLAILYAVRIQEEEEDELSLVGRVPPFVETATSRTAIWQQIIYANHMCRRCLCPA